MMAVEVTVGDAIAGILLCVVYVLVMIQECVELMVMVVCEWLQFGFVGGGMVFVFGVLLIGFDVVVCIECLIWIIEHVLVD